MGQLKRINFVLILLTSVLFSCMDNQDKFAERRVPVDIYDLAIPANGEVNQDIEIQLKAQAPNGCYSDLEVKLIKIDSRHFLFKANGLFESNGVCPYNLVNKDTVITFRPTSTGKYFFQTNEEPFEIRKDTIDIRVSLKTLPS